MVDPDDIPMTQEELELARKGALIVAAAVADPQARAPQALRERLETERGAATRSGRRRPAWLGALVGGLAAVLLAIVLLSGGGDDAPGGPGVLQVASVARLSPTGPAPASLGGLQPKLDAEVDGVAFPDWFKEFEWETVGTRRDTVGGRAVTTVVYRNPAGAQAGYAIVAGPRLAAPEGAREIERRGFTYRVVRGRGRTTVTWEEQGHTCVLDAPDSIPEETLIDLAAWDNV